MAVATQSDVIINGESFDLFSIPDPRSKMVQNAKEALLCSHDLTSLVDDLGKLENFIRVAYNGVAGNTEVQIKVQRFGYKFTTKLADKSAVTVHSFKRASQDVLQELQGTYQYLLDGLEEMALETLSHLTDVAAEMATAAEKLHHEFERAITDVIDALEDTQKDVVKAIESLLKIGDNTGHIEAMKRANDDDDCALMMNAALFWRQMQGYCESLAKINMHQYVEKAMKYPEETRLKVWLSKAFKVKVVQYYSMWVALDDVCEVYMLQIKDTRQDLYSYLAENPTIEEAKKNVRELAATFAADLEKAQEKLAEKQKEALEEKKSLEDFK